MVGPRWSMSARSTARPVRLHVDAVLAARAPRVAAMVSPLLRDINGTRAADDRWAPYAQIASSLFELSPLDECDYAVLPYPWQAAVDHAELHSAAEQYADRARTVGRELLVFYQHDDERLVIDLPNAVVFRTSMCRSRRRPNEFAQPAWADDLLVRFRGARVSIRPKAARPTVGFCGYAPPHGLPLGRQWLKEQARAGIGALGIGERLGISTAMQVRRRAIDLFQESSLTDTNFLFRDGTYTDEHGNVGPYHGSFEYRGEYVQNTVASDFVLCTRGWGNFSFRLYESLCLGRIPIFVDTDCVLPFDELIDWHSLCVWVEQRDLDELPQIVREAYDAMDPAEFARRQLQCRETWKSYLSPEGFFRYLHHWLLRRQQVAPRD
jgi:hypothetical protein